MSLNGQVVQMLVFRTGPWRENVSVLFNFKAFLNILAPAHSLNTVATFQHIFQPLVMRSKRSLCRLHANMRCIICKADTISLQTKNFGGSQPKPVWKVGDSRYTGTTFGPHKFHPFCPQFYCQRGPPLQLSLPSHHAFLPLLWLLWLPSHHAFLHPLWHPSHHGFDGAEICYFTVFFLQPVNGDLAPRHYYDYYYIPTGEGTMTIGWGGGGGPRACTIYIYIHSTWPLHCNSEHNRGHKNLHQKKGFASC